MAAVWDLVWVVMMGYKQADETGEYTVARLANNWVKQKVERMAFCSAAQKGS